MEAVNDFSLKINSKSEILRPLIFKKYSRGACCFIEKKLILKNKTIKKDKIFLEEDSFGNDPIKDTFFDKVPALRSITNEKYIAQERKQNKSFRNTKNEIARERWKMLAKALLKCKPTISANEAEDISVRRFTTFQLIQPIQTAFLKKGNGYWVDYEMDVYGKTYRIKIHHLEQKLTPKDLAGFNNTGNICIWPSEEVLAFYLLCNINTFKGKEIVEIGGGMTCLAGLMLSCYGGAKRVDLTDGNFVSVENVKEIVKRNRINQNVVKCYQLDWMNYRYCNTVYDVVLSSDCLFFDETRSGLVETIWQCLKEDGVAFVMAPKRGTTLNSFLKLASTKGFYWIIRNNYDEKVWKQHQKFKKSDIKYDKNLHYPMLIVLSKNKLNLTKNTNFT